MKTKIISFLTLTVITCYFAITTNGQYYAIAGSRAAGMGNTSTAVEDIWSCSNNQAGMALIKKPEIGISYSTSFMIKETSTKTICIVLPLKPGVFGITYSHFGYQLYNTQKAGIGYSRDFSKKIRAGLQLDYLMTNFGNNYGNKNNVTFEIGVQTDISENITIGVWTFNPVLVKLNTETELEESIPGVLRIGARWKLSPSLMLTIETEKNTVIDPVVFRGGLEYSIKDKFFIRTGTTTCYEIFTLGVGINLTYFEIDFSAKNASNAWLFTTNINNRKALEMKIKNTILVFFLAISPIFSGAK